MKHTSTLLALAVGAVLLQAGCSREQPAAARAPAAKPAASAPAKAPTAQVARIVFIDQEKCCACTHKRIDSSWAALTNVVGFPPDPDVERLHMDSQKKQAAPYLKQHAVMVPPAIYFFDKAGKLATFLQGEATEKQIREALR